MEQKEFTAKWESPTELVIAADAGGKETARTMFTDVFVLRDGRWQAVNAQENAVPGR
jgi:hypothetical protein